MSYEELAALAAAYERLERLESGLTQADQTRRQIQALNSADSKRSVGLSADILLKIPRGKAAALNAEIPVSFSLKPGSLAIIAGELHGLYPLRRQRALDASNPLSPQRRTV